MMMQRERTALSDRRSLPLFGLATLVLAAIVSIFILHPFTPDVPHAGLDPSWIAITGEAAAARARWGVDIIFTYGPASPLVTNYFNSDYFSRTFPLMILCSLVHGLCAAALLTQRSGRSLPAAAVSALGVACYALVLIAARQNPDAFYFCTILLVFLLDLQRDPENSLARVATILGVATTGMFCLSKLSYGLIALPLFVLGDVRAVWSRRPPFRMGLMLAAFLATYLFYGQRLGDLPVFLAMQKEIIAGYTDAMSIGGYRVETAAFVAFAAIFVFLVCGVEALTRGPWIDRLMLPAGLVAFMVVVFKAGFVRQDLHTLTSWLSFALAGVMVAFGRILPRSTLDHDEREHDVVRTPVPTFRQPALAATVLTALSLVAAVIVYPYVVAASNEEPNSAAAMLQTYEEWFSSGPPGEIAAMRTAFGNPEEFAAAQWRAKDQAWADIRKQFPLRKFDGTVDMIQSDQTDLMANGVDYDPRPVFHEYSTYTPELMRVNKAFYESGKAPDWVIFAPGSIDDRYPAFAEGPLWPEFIRRYEPVSREDTNVLLHRRAQPGPEMMGPGTTRVAHLDEFVPVDASTPVFARIILKPTLLGRLMALVYRSPLITMVLRLGNGQEQPYRFIPAFGAGGFVLSPEISSADDFARLAFGIGDTSPRSTVTGVEILGGRLVRLAYGSDVTFEFAPMSVPKGDHSEAAEAFYADLSGGAWRDLVKRAGREATLDGDRLPLQPPDRLVIPLAGARHLSFAYGLEHGAWTPPNRTDGVCFSLKPVGSGPIWQRCLDPLRAEADRAEQSALVDIPAGTNEVAIETSCRASCDWAWSYIKDAKPVN